MVWVERWLRHTVDDLAARGGMSSALPILFGILISALIAAGALGWFAASRSGRAVDLTDAPPLSVAVTGPEVTAESTPTVRVHVVGAVRTPGVFSMHEGRIVADAIGLAGGPADDAALDAINLAETVWDGQQIRVPSSAELEEGGTAATLAAGLGASSSSGPVNVNTADSTLLQTLPGIGAATAAKIIDDRDRNGRFASLDDLMRVSGIGEKKVEALRDLAVAR